MLDRRRGDKEPPARPILGDGGTIWEKEIEMYQHLTKSFLAGVALLALGIMSIHSPAWGAKGGGGPMACAEGEGAYFDSSTHTWECDTFGDVISEKIVFLSSVETPGNMGGPEGADQICNDLAFTAGLQGASETNFMAWISQDGLSAPQRFDGGHLGRYVLPDVEATVVAYTWDDLIDGTISHPIDVAEGGGDPIGSTAPGVWTGTRRVFVAGVEVWGPSLDNCANWTSASSDPSVRGVRGEVSHPNFDNVDVPTYDMSWSWGWPFRCDVPRRLYCFEQ
jgi:hypothetical protein